MDRRPCIYRIKKGFQFDHYSVLWAYLVYFDALQSYAQVHNTLYHRGYNYNMIIFFSKTVYFLYLKEKTLEIFCYVYCMLHFLVVLK